MLQDVYVQQDNNVVETRSKIARIQAHKLANIPITPPPYRDKPNKEGALLLQVETND
ncbi:MAG: mandelate racemase/muconate lactonizing enzyme family protein, partial [Mesorhizobium sp.]